MPMATVSTGDVIAAGDHNSIVNALKGTTGENLTVFTKGVDIVSANALVLGTDGNYWHVTGTTAITSISSLPAGTVIKLEFDGALTLTHNATTLILQGATNYTTTAGDVFEFTSEGSGNWRETGRGLSAVSAGFGAVPSLTLSTVGAAGSGNGFVRRNATIALFDTTAARAVAFGDVGTTGGVNFASPRDHGHAFALGATVIASTNNGLTVASTNGNLGWTAVALATHTTPAATATVAGHVPTPPNNTTDFLRGDATWAVPAVAAQTLGVLNALGTFSVFTLSGTAFTPIPMTETYDPLGWHSVASTTIWTAPVAGSYLVNVYSNYDGNVAADGLVILSVRVNGGNTPNVTRFDIDRRETRGPGVSNQPTYHGALVVASMNGSTDFFEITHYTPGANDTVSGRLSIVRVL